MKKLILITGIILFTCSFSAFAQDDNYPCPPGAWCHPNGEGLGRGPWETGGMNAMEDAASDVGEELKGNPCATLDLYCNLGKWLSDHIACGYGKDTPQYQMCNKKQSLGKPLTEKEKAILNQVSFNSFSINTNYRPLYFDSKEGKKSFKTTLNKLKRGQIVKKWKQGYTLTFGYKYFTSKKKSDYGVMYYLKNKKGGVIGNIFIFTKGNRFYMFNLNMNK